MPVCVAIVHPAPKVLRKLLHTVLHGHEPASAGQTFDPQFKLMGSLFRLSNFGSLKGETQKVRVICLRHLAFLVVDLEFEPMFNGVTH